MQNKNDMQGQVVLLLDLLGVFLVSSVMQNNETGTTTKNRQIPSTFKYYSNRKGSQVVEVDSENRCHIFDNGHARWMLQTREIVTTLNYIQFQILLEKCQLDSFQLKEDAEDHLKQLSSGQFTEENDLNKDSLMSMWNASSMGQNTSHDIFHSHLLFNETDVAIFMELPDNSNGTEEKVTPLIFPGTKWCGRGDIARSEDDIGIYAETDKCCREHDHCPENIVARSSKYGLNNTGDYTRSSCECDQKFLECLEKDQMSFSALTSFKIGNIYFNLLKPRCFSQRHPVRECRQTRLSGECIAFQYDFQRPTQYQFFPAQPYILRSARKLFDTILYRNLDLTRPFPTSIPLPNTALLQNISAIIPRPNLSIG